MKNTGHNIEPVCRRNKGERHCSGIGYLLRNGVDDATEFVKMLKNHHGSEERLIFLAEQVKAAYWIAATATLAEELEDLFSLSEKCASRMWRHLDSSPFRSWSPVMREDLSKLFSELIERTHPLFMEKTSCFAEDTIESMLLHQ